MKVNINKKPEIKLFSLKELAIIIPTKDRPKELNRLLNSIIKQETEIGKVIIVFSGEDINFIVEKYKKLIPIISIRSNPGQIHQRNKGISLLDDKIKLVACIDDDLVFKRNAFLEMMKFWNETHPETAGVGFNIINLKKPKSFLLMNYLKIKSDVPGKILKNGSNTWITNIDSDIKTEWLNGGATVWKKTILKKYKNKEIKSEWACFEDVIFSYPLSKKYSMYVCADAKVVVDEFDNRNEKPKKLIMRGKNTLLWHYYFVKKNFNLSEYSFVIFYLFRIIKLIFNLLFLFEFSNIFTLFGFSKGIILILYAKIKKIEFTKILESNF